VARFVDGKLRSFSDRMNLLTRIIASIRYPESALGKTLQRIVPVIVLMLMVLFGLSGFAINSCESTSTKWSLLHT